MPIFIWTRGSHEDVYGTKYGALDERLVPRGFLYPVHLSNKTSESLLRLLIIWSLSTCIKHDANFFINFQALINLRILFHE